MRKSIARMRESLVFGLAHLLHHASLRLSEALTDDLRQVFREESTHTYTGDDMGGWLAWPGFGSGVRQREGQRETSGIGAHHKSIGVDIGEIGHSFSLR